MLQPKATFRFPIGEFSLEEREEDDVPRLSINGIVKGPILYGVGDARYMDEELKLRYLYKVVFSPQCYSFVFTVLFIYLFVD